MEKEKILEASRNDNKNKDYAEIEIENKGIKYCALATLILASIYFCMEIFVKGITNYGWYSIIALYCAVMYGYKAIKLKRKLYIFCAIVWGLLSILLIYTYINSIFQTSEIL